MARTDKNLYDLLIASECYIETVNKSDKSKVSRRRQGEPTTQPASRIGKVAWELGYRAWTQEQTKPPEPKPPDPVPTTKYAPQSYNQGSSGQNARYNIQINCTRVPNSPDSVDGEGVVYDDGGRQRGNIRSEQNIVGLKPADMMDNKEPWDPYEWMGKTFPPYPDKSYER